MHAVSLEQQFRHEEHVLVLPDLGFCAQSGMRGLEFATAQSPQVDPGDGEHVEEEEDGVDVPDAVDEVGEDPAEVVLHLLVQGLRLADSVGPISNVQCQNPLDKVLDLALEARLRGRLLGGRRGG